MTTRNLVLLACMFFIGIFIVYTIGRKPTNAYTVSPNNVERGGDVRSNPITLSPDNATNVGVAADQSSKSPTALEIEEILTKQGFEKGKEAIMLAFKRWGAEAPYAAIAFLASRGEIPPTFRAAFLHQILASWVLLSPDEAWQWALGSNGFAGSSERMLRAMTESLTGVGRFEVAGTLIGQTSALVGGLTIVEFAAAWGKTNAVDGERWVNSLSGIAKVNATVGLAQAIASEDANIIIDRVGAMPPEEAGRVVMGLMNELRNDHIALLNFMAKLPKPDDFRYEDAIRTMFLLGRVETLSPTLAVSLIDKLVHPSSITRSAADYVVTHGAESPSDSIMVAKRYLNYDQTVAALGKALNRTAVRGQSSRKLLDHLEQTDALLGAAVVRWANSNN